HSGDLMILTGGSLTLIGSTFLQFNGTIDLNGTASLTLSQSTIEFYQQAGQIKAGENSSIYMTQSVLSNSSINLFNNAGLNSNSSNFEKILGLRSDELTTLSLHSSRFNGSLGAFIFSGASVAITNSTLIYSSSPHVTFAGITSLIDSS